jgi:hypothetical protein
MSLEALGAVVGMSAASLSRIERGLQKPPLRVVRAVIELTGGALALDAFFGLTAVQWARAAQRGRAAGASAAACVQ